MKIVWLLLIGATIIFGKGSSKKINLKKKFPSYKYVLKQFDIEPSYIDDPYFRNFIIKNESKYRRFYLNSLRRGKDFIPLFKNMLVSKGLSHLFIYMSMTESGFQRGVLLE